MGNAPIQRDTRQGIGMPASNRILLGTCVYNPIQGVDRRKQRASPSKQSCKTHSFLLFLSLSFLPEESHCSRDMSTEVWPNDAICWNLCAPPSCLFEISIIIHSKRLMWRASYAFPHKCPECTFGCAATGCSAKHLALLQDVSNCYEIPLKDSLGEFHTSTVHHPQSCRAVLMI